MPKTRLTLDELFAALPADRLETMTSVHKAIRKAAPKLAVTWIQTQLSHVGPVE
jgi:hypothetical protein